MAHDEGTAQLLRDDLADLDPTEKRMFGGLCFMHQGNMLCGVLKSGALYRVGKENMAEALALPDVQPMEMGGRRMGGFVEATPDALADDETRARLTTLMRSFHATLDPRERPN